MLKDARIGQFAPMAQPVPRIAHLGSHASRRYGKMPLAQYLPDGPLDGTICPNLRQKMHTLRHIAHKFARVLIEKQIDVHPVAVERTKQAY